MGKAYPETVGKPGPGVEIKIDDSGEGCVQEPRRLSAILQG